jgi:cobalt-precorrin 5A hydrolase
MGAAVTAALAIGLGCRRGCSADEIVALVEESCRGLDRAGARLFTIERKRHEPGLLDAAHRLALPLAFFEHAALMGVPGVATVSARVAAAVGVPSVAEAAALAGAGAGARLVVPRRATAGATCAVARSEAA